MITTAKGRTGRRGKVGREPLCETVYSTHERQHAGALRVCISAYALQPTEYISSLAAHPHRHPPYHIDTSNRTLGPLERTPALMLSESGYRALKILT